MAETANIMLPGAPNQPVPGITGTGAINGGLLRPGSIDQSQFQQLLQAQQQANEAATAQPGLTLNDYRKLAGAPRAATSVGLTTPAPAAPPLASSDGIPTLSAEQFAVLAGMSGPEEPVATPEEIHQILPNAPAPPLETIPAQIAPSQIAPAQIGSAGDPALDGDGVPVMDPVEVEAEKSPDESGDPRVVWFDSMPDRDDRRMLEAAGKKWRIRETPGARELFLGPDGKFGWDDFVDIINPLQHIPIVAQIYRAVTGDQAYALSQFAGALPFGPISVASAVVDTIVRAQTGRDAGTDLAAAVLGIDNRTPEEANIHLVTGGTGGLASVAMPGPAPLQGASVPDTPLTPSAWKRESSGDLRSAG